jgi:hypothetical protein
MNKLKLVGLSAYTVAVLIIVIVSLASCSSGNYTPCYAYQNVELNTK